jgi:Sap, sulfolipid-1-addressing protein
MSAHVRAGRSFTRSKWAHLGGARLQTRKQTRTSKVVFSAMWSTLLVLALLAGLDPIRLGWTLLVVSRPRPIQNLFAYWVGTMTVSVLLILGPLMLVNATPKFNSFTDNLATNPTFRQIQTGLGVLVLSVVAVMVVRSLARRRQRALVSTPSGAGSTLVLDSNTPTASSPLPVHAQDAATEDGSAIRWLLGRARNAWENGSLWVSFVIGVGCVPPIDGTIFILAIAVTSGAELGTQLIAAIVFVVGTLVVVEIMLIGYLAVPAKTEAMLRLLHNWALAHRRHVLFAIFAVVGVSLVAHGTGIVGAGG